MRPTSTLLVALLFMFVSTATARPALEEGFAVGAAREVVVTGTVIDSAAGTPIAAAQITVLTDTLTERTTTGPDGVFRLTLSSPGNLGTLSIEVSAYGYQSKYVETLLRDTFRNRVDGQIRDRSVALKSKKFSATLACDASADIESKSGSNAPVKIVCGDGLTGVEVGVRKNRIAILATPPYTLRVESGRVELRDFSGGRVEIRVDAAMLPR